MDGAHLQHFPSISGVPAAEHDPGTGESSAPLDTDITSVLSRWRDSGPVAQCVSPRGAGIPHINLTHFSYTNLPVLVKPSAQVQTDGPGSRCILFCLLLYGLGAVHKLTG